MKIALFCLEASRDSFGHQRIRFALCVITWTATSATLLTAVGPQERDGAIGRPFHDVVGAPMRPRSAPATPGLMVAAAGTTLLDGLGARYDREPAARDWRKILILVVCFAFSIVLMWFSWQDDGQHAGLLTAVIFAMLAGLFAMGVIELPTGSKVPFFLTCGRDSQTACRRSSRSE